MRTWGSCLDAAVIDDTDLRADYRTAARFLRRREPALFAALRLLAPPEFQPHMCAGYAFAGFTDDVCDQCAEQTRAQRLDAWTLRVRAAVAGDAVDHPLLRAFLHSCTTRGLPLAWVDAYLTGARADLDFAGFETEADYQRYIDQLSWPFAMTTAGLVHPGGGDERWAGYCRWLADGCQRGDFLADLAEDLRRGHLYLPLDALDRHGVSPADLTHGHDSAGVRTLLAEMAERARTALHHAEGFITQAPAAHHPLHRFVVELYHQRLTGVIKLGPSLAKQTYRDDPWACVRLLHRAKRADTSGSSLTTVP